jgi:hypothetical protein
MYVAHMGDVEIIKEVWHMGCENTHLLDTAEYRIQVCSDKHCNGYPAKQNEFAAFWKSLCNFTGVPEMETLCLKHSETIPLWDSYCWSGLSCIILEESHLLLRICCVCVCQPNKGRSYGYKSIGSRWQLFQWEPWIPNAEYFRIK